VAAPDSYFYEIEFTPGVWTDVAPWVDGTVGGSTQFGRTSPYSAASVGTLNGVTLDNTDGRFSPKRQTLVDGVTAHPYYPNVVPRKRIRFGYVKSAVRYTRFVGYIKGWPTTQIDGHTPRVVITATTRDDRMSRDPMRATIAQEAQFDGVVGSWPLTDAAGSTSAHAEQISFPALPVVQYGAGGALLFGDNGPGDGGTGVKFAPASASAGQILHHPTAMSKFTPTAFTMLVWVQPGTSLPAWGAMTAAGCTINGLSFQFVIDAAGKFNGFGPSLLDGGWHLLAQVYDGAHSFYYVDGVSVASGLVPVNSGTFRNLAIGDSDQFVLGNVVGSHYRGNIGPVMLVPNLMGAARLVAEYSAGLAWVGELVSDRIKRFLSYGGLTSSDWNIDTSTVTCSSYPQAGKDITGACQDLVATEGGGAVFYFGPDGQAQFRNRSFRKPSGSVLALNAEADLDGTTFSATYDDTQIVNQSQGSRSTASGGSTTQVVDNAASETTYGLSGDSFSSYAQSDSDVLYNAQDRVASQREPAVRIDKVPVDLFTSTNAGIYAAVAGTDIGERITITSLSPTISPATQIDVIAEGWADVWNADGFITTFDTSPADNPPRRRFDDTFYGRFAANPDCKLNAAITAAATTIVIACPTGPTFTLVGARYPLKIKVEEEIIQLNFAPGGAPSPQTFTCSRGVDGTTAVAHPINTLVQVWPAGTFTL
jgi:hypothetical protein